MVIITTRVRQMNDIVKTFEDGPESVQEILWSEGPWPRLGEELEKAWKNYYEVQGYSPFATCGNDQSRSKDFCVLTSAALPFTSPCSPMHASFTPSTPDSQVPGVDSSYSPLQQLRGGVSPSGGQPYGIVQISSVCWGCKAYLPGNLPLPRCSSRKSLCACLSCAHWFHLSCFVVLNARSARRDLIITSSTVVYSGRLATLFTSCGVILKSLYSPNCVMHSELLQMLGLAFLKLFVQLSTLLFF